MDIETVAIDSLMPNPENYRQHPPDQIAHLVASLEQYGWARNVVVSADGVILAGHGIVQAARQAGRTEVPIHRLPWPATDPRCRKFMVLENEVSRLAEDDNDRLAALLAEVQRDDSLLGTGYEAEEVTALLGDLGNAEGDLDLVAREDANLSASRMTNYRNPGAVIVSFGDLASVALAGEDMDKVAQGLAAMYEGAPRDQLRSLLDEIANQTLHSYA